MILRDEEVLLGDCFRSIRGLVDEIVVGVDSRTTDRTEKIARLNGARVHAFDWQDDFSAARNIGLRKVKSDWALVIDADDRLTDWGFATIREVLRRPRSDVDVYGLLIENRRLDGTLLKVDPLPSVRLFPNHRGIHYVNRVHEVLKGKRELRIGWLRGGVAITHLGYDPELYDKRLKDARNLKLLIKQIEERPDDRLLWYELARQHVIGGRLQDASATAQVALKHVPGYLRPELIAELEKITTLDSHVVAHT